MRLSFSKLWGSPDQPATESHRPFNNNEEAKAARDAKYRELKAAGITAHRSVLKGQLRKYWSFGVTCGDFCDVYELNIKEN